MKKNCYLDSPYGQKKNSRGIRNAIVAAYIWSIRKQWTTYMYNKYYRLTSAEAAQKTIAGVGDIKRAWKTTTLRDKNRMFYSNYSTPWAFAPFRSEQFNNMVGLYKAIIKGEMTMYRDMCKMFAPKVWEYAVNKGVYPECMR
jgi:hypothetical protein